MAFQVEELSLELTFGLIRLLPDSVESPAGSTDCVRRFDNSMESRGGVTSVSSDPGVASVLFESMNPFRRVLTNCLLC
jgi:hypothetical protein